MRLFDTFSAAGYHTTLISSFGVDFEAYEDIALSRLRDAGCTNNILVADARMLAQALGDSTRRPKAAGRRYSVVGAQCAGVFHPKLVLQLGKTSGRLLVMSANMTAAGLAGNFEVVGEVVVADGAQEAAPLLRAALDYFLEFLVPTSAAHRQVTWALKRALWVPPPGDVEAFIELLDGSRLAFLRRNPAKGIGERFIELVGSRSVKRLVVVSPYWDSDLHALTALQRRTNAKAVATVIQPQSALYPVHAHPTADGFKLFDVTRVRGADASRFAHAKVLIAESDSGDCILFGSANCTTAALGGPTQPGQNEEACLFRDAPSGEAVKLLGLDDVLGGVELAVTGIPAFVKAEDIPLLELEAKLPGRFELSGDVLRWWPPTTLPLDGAIIDLLDRQAESLPGDLIPLDLQTNPKTYRLAGTIAPYFARVRSGGFESSLAIVVVEQAIQEAQRSTKRRGAESALDLLDDESATEGLWLLEVIQRLTEAERELREPRDGHQAPTKPPAADDAPDTRILSYDQFVAGRRSSDDAGRAAGSHLAATQFESVRGFLNALIGKRAALDLGDVAGEEGTVPELGLGDNNANADAIEAGDSHSASSNPVGDVPAAEARKKLKQRQKYVQDTQRTIIKGVDAFLAGLREAVEGGRSLGAIDLLRFRALLVVVLGAGSKKADLLPKDVTAQVHRRQVLPSTGEGNWRSVCLRLLFDFFREHAGSRAPLIKSLMLESEGDLALPEDVLECWATCFWTICAARVAVTDTGTSFQPSKSELLLASDLYKFTRLLPEQALGEVVGNVFEGMDRRYGERLGVAADALDREHRRLVDAARAATSTPMAL